MNEVNVLLTEIALNLLGNTFYDINGEPADDLQTLYRQERKKSKTGKPNLTEILGIYGSQKSSSPTTASSSSVVRQSKSGPGLLPTTVSTSISTESDENVITLDDDEDDMELEAESKIESVAEKSPETKPASTPPPPAIATKIYLQPPNNNSQVTKPVSTKSPSHPVNKVVSKSFGNSPAATNSSTPNKPAPALADSHTILSSDSELEEVECEEYESPIASVRLNYIAKKTDIEFDRMKADVTNQKRAYEAANRNLITLMKLKPKELWRRFLDQQRQELIDESNALMQFIRVIKNSDKINPKVLSKVAKDILAAKDSVP